MRIEGCAYIADSVASPSHLADNVRKLIHRRVARNSANNALEGIL